MGQGAAMQADPPIRAVLFDKDGTLTDFRATWDGWLGRILDDLAHASGAPVAALADAIGYDLDADAMRKDGLFVTATTRASVRTLSAATGWAEDRVAAWWGPRIEGRRQVAVPGVAALFETLAGRGLVLGVLTNDERHSAQTHLRALGVADRIAALIASDDGHGAKPDPAGARAFAAAVGIAPASILLVGDGATDRDAAAGAGMPFVGVLTGTLGAEDFPEARGVLRTATELPEWLDGARSAAPH